MDSCAMPIPLEGQERDWYSVVAGVLCPSRGTTRRSCYYKQWILLLY